MSNGYESPIRVTIDEISRTIEDPFSERVYQAVCEAKITVDKEELIKALANERRQWECGYAEGRKAGLLEAESALLEAYSLLGRLANDIDKCREGRL